VDDTLTDGSCSIEHIKSTITDSEE